MIAEYVAQSVVVMFAVYGAWHGTIQMVVGVVCWWGRREQARVDREREAEKKRAEATKAEARRIANEWMLSRLTLENHDAIARIISESQKEEAA